MKKDMIELTYADIPGGTFFADPGSVVLIERCGETRTAVTFNTGERREVTESAEKVRQMVQPPVLVGR